MTNYVVSIWACVQFVFKVYILTDNYYLIKKKKLIYQVRLGLRVS